MKQKLAYLVGLLLFFMPGASAVEVSFIALDAKSGKVLIEKGSSIDVRISPCSTYKIALSVMGYDKEILKNEREPVFPYPGCNVQLASHKQAQSPKSWMEFSVVWYSKELIRRLGLDAIQHYLSLFSYGNQDASGEKGERDGFLTAHLLSSLKISPREQVLFLQKLVHEELPVSSKALEMTKAIIYDHAFGDGWKMFGKTGTGFHKDGTMTLWYVGWVEKGSVQYPFALVIQNAKECLSKEKRQNVVKDFLIFSQEIF